jgi:UDP-glucuronate 4-epimerase
MAILITGGAGFIGSHVAQRLLQDGEEVIIIDNFNDYYAPQLKRDNITRLNTFGKPSVIEGDIRDVECVNKMFADYDIQRVVHLAAMGGVRNSVSQIPTYLGINLNGTMNLLEAATSKHIQQFVFASTSSVYGITPHLPFTETDTADRPLTVYAASKRSAEMLAHTYHNLHQMNVTVLRFFNVYGPAGRPDMMPMRLFKATHDNSVIKLFNNGDIARDWTYIDDTVDGILSALQRPLGYEIINLGVGSPVSMTEFLSVIQNLTGKTIRVEAVPTPLSDPPITFCNNQKARELLGFAPKISVQEGLAKTWEWLKTHNS